MGGCCLVYDGSTDGTWDVVQAFADVPNITLVRRARNQGKVAALRDGFAQATNDIVIVQDADLEYNPSDYPKLIQPILDDQADVVFGSRFIGGEARRVLYFWHAVGNRVLTALSNLCTNVDLTDIKKPATRCFGWRCCSGSRSKRIALASSLSSRPMWRASTISASSR